MVFTVFLQKHSDILRDLLELKFPEGAKIIDFTFGTGALWWTIFEDPYLNSKYKVTGCDSKGKPPVKRNLFTDSYDDLGLHDGGVFDPAYLIRRDSFDYEVKVDSHGVLSHREMRGPRSWAATDLKDFTSNQSVEEFNRRVEALREKAPTVLKPSGLLFVKVMDVRYKGRLIPHHFNIFNILSPKFELTDHGIYIRQGATTWKIKNHLQNLHGHWMIFQLKAQ